VVKSVHYGVRHYSTCAVETIPLALKRHGDNHNLPRLPCSLASFRTECCREVQPPLPARVSRSVALSLSPGLPIKCAPVD
jgi:hypothetical protein